MLSIPLFSPLIERALRVAAVGHEKQYRKATLIPYVTHPVHVAWILMRAGFTDETLLAAALLHDCVEDADLSLDDLREQFPEDVVEIVREVSERKRDSEGRPRSWEDRKREHLEEMGRASLAARAVTIADKLHNLATIRKDLEHGAEVWNRFNARPERILWYCREMVTRAATDDSRLQELLAACEVVLLDLEARISGESAR